MQSASKKRKSIVEKEVAIERTAPYPLYKLVCTGFRDTRPLAFLLFPRGNCSFYGSKIAASLVNLAATRIFSEPEQSILELPVNSFDAYSPEGSVGKFGLGFFSILYWLVGHPERSVNITSVRNRKRVYARIQEVEGVLSFQIEWDPNQAPIKNCTRVVLDCTKDPLSSPTLQRFSKQLAKLQYVRGADLQVNQFGFHGKQFGVTYIVLPNNGYVSYNNEAGNPNKIYLTLSPEGLFVQDFASGLSLKTLLTKMLVPTVSVKLPQSEEKQEILHSQLQENEDVNRIMFLVRSVAVVSLEFVLPNYLNYNLVLDLPSSTPVPVSRDDILLNPALERVLSAQLQVLVEQCISLKNLRLLEVGVATYIEYTTHEKNKEFFKHFLKSLHSPRVIRVHFQNFNMLDQLAPSNPFVESEHQDTEKLIDFLKQQTFTVRQDIYFNKTVVPASIEKVYHPDNLRVTNAKLPFFVFVDKKHFSVLSLPTLYPQDKLYFKNTDYTERISSDLVALLQKCFQKSTGNPLSEALPILSHLSFEMVFKWLTYGDQNKYLFTNTKYTRCTGKVKLINKKRVAIFPFLFDLFWLLNVAPVHKVVTYMYQVFDVFAYYAATTVTKVYGGAQDTPFTLQDLGFSPAYEQLFSVPQNQALFTNLLTRLSEQGYVLEWGIALQNKVDNSVKSWSFFNPVYFLFFLEFLPLDSPHTNVVLISLFIKFLIENKHVGVQQLLQTTCLLDCVFMSEKKVLLQDLFDTQFDKMYAFIQQFYVESELLTDWLSRAPKLSLVRERFVTEARVWLGLQRDVVPIRLPFLDVNAPYSFFSQSHFVHFVLTHDLNPNFEKVFQDVENWEPREDLRLPITEIAINEGSVKSFVNSVLTETIQNSLDAIRSKAALARAEVRCEVGENELFYIYKITDFVGMEPDNVLSLMIPFLSSKKSGQQTTGEMGSGFFNVYRESELVIIDSTFRGKRTLIVDEPVLNDKGRVVDLNRRVQVTRVRSLDHNQTDIYVCIDKTDVFKISRFITFIKNVLPLVPDVPIYFNNQLLEMPTVLLLDTEMFTASYIVQPNIQSYVLTKGIPFAPLYEFVKTSELFQFPQSEYLIKEFHTGVVVQLKNNVFTPVQTRARINLMPNVVEPLKKFLLDVLYLFLLKKISEQSVSNVNHYLPHFTSDAPLSQLLPSKFKDIIKLEGYGSITQISPLLVYQNYPGTFLSFSDMVHDVFLMFQDTPIDFDIVKRTRADKYPPLLFKVVLQWLGLKNRELEGSASSGTGSPSFGTEVYDKLKLIFKEFVKVFWKLGDMLQVKNLANRFEPEVELEFDSKSGFIAQYHGTFDNGNKNKERGVLLHTISINMFYIETMVSLEEVTQFLNVFEIQDTQSFMQQLQSLEHNHFWINFFSNSPQNVLVHELEHARRNLVVFSVSKLDSILHRGGEGLFKSELLEGSHDNITDMLSPLLKVVKTYTFDEAALEVYKLLLANQFLERLHMLMTI